MRVVVLERDRHEDLIGELREAGARVNLIRDGDVAPAIAAARPETGVDLLYGIGGTPGGRHLGGGAEVPSAAASRAKLWPRNDEERQRARRRRLRPRPRAHDRRPRRAATTSSSPRPASRPARCCAAIRYVRDGAVTDSIVMRSRSGTVRRIEARHKLSKLAQFTGREY